MGMRTWGEGRPVLMVPGWNTTAAMVRSWLPEAFLARHRCLIWEWPGLGEARDQRLPTALEDMLDDMARCIVDPMVTVVGYCLGGVAAWALAQRHPDRIQAVVMVETPLHFPLVLTPMLAPGLGPGMLDLVRGTRLGRHAVRRAILHPGITYPDTFLDTLFAFESKPACHYLRLFQRYGAGLGPGTEPLVSRRPCWQIVGERPLGAMAAAWGPRQIVQARHVILEGAGHFPAVEAPQACFDRIESVVMGQGASEAPPASPSAVSEPK